MTDASWYRAQAERYLRQAEEAEKLDVLKELPFGTVITFSRVTGIGTRARKSFSYAAILVDTFSPAAARTAPMWRERYATSTPKWFVTQGDRGSAPRTPDDFIKWLMDGQVDDILIVDGVVTLAQWRERLQAEVRGMVNEGYPGEATLDETATNLRIAAQKLQEKRTSAQAPVPSENIAEARRTRDIMGANDPQGQ